MFGSIGQINLVVPSELPETGTVSVQIKTSQGTSAAFLLQMAPADVGMFRIGDPSKSTRDNGALFFAGTVWRVMPASLAAAIGFPNCDGAAALTVCGQPAASGDSIVIFLTGEGKATPDGDPAGQPVPTGSVAPLAARRLYRYAADADCKHRRHTGTAVALRYQPRQRWSLSNKRYCAGRSAIGG